MGFLWVTLNVSDLDKTQEFYENVVGLKLIRRFNTGGPVEIAFLSDGKSQTQVELITNSAAPPIAAGSDYSLGFEVDSADAMMETAKENGIPIASEMISPQPDIKFFYVLDPDGRKVQFVQNI